MDELGICDPGCCRRICHFLALGEFRVRIRLEEVEAPIFRQSVIDPRVALKLKHPVRAPRRAFQHLVLLRRKLRRDNFDLPFLLIVRVVLQFSGGNQPLTLREIPDHQLLRRKYLQALVPDHCDVDLSSFNELFDERMGFGMLMYELHALGQLLFTVYD